MGVIRLHVHTLLVETPDVQNADAGEPTGRVILLEDSQEIEMVFRDGFWGWVSDGQSRACTRDPGQAIRMAASLLMDQATRKAPIKLARPPTPARAPVRVTLDPHEEG